MYSDLHCHTVLSDGSNEVSDVLFQAQKSGLKSVAVTDHDTFRGSEEALKLAKNYDIEVIPGLEISCFDHERGQKVHMLCYFPKNISEIEKVCSKTLKLRRESGFSMMNKIIKRFNISADMVKRYYKNSKSIYKQHIMRALMDAGYTGTIYGNLYKLLFNPKTGIAYEKFDYPDCRDIINLIHKSGGVASLAHPSQFNSFDLLKELTIKYNLNAVEVYHPRNEVSKISYLESFAKEYDLVMTGGTDFHGAYSNSPMCIGTKTTTIGELKKLKNKAQII